MMIKCNVSHFAIILKYQSQFCRQYSYHDTVYHKIINSLDTVIISCFYYDSFFYFMCAAKMSRFWVWLWVFLAYLTMHRVGKILCFPQKLIFCEWIKQNFRLRCSTMQPREANPIIYDGNEVGCIQIWKSCNLSNHLVGQQRWNFQCGDCHFPTATIVNCRHRVTMFLRQKIMSPMRQIESFHDCTELKKKWEKSPCWMSYL